jgi:poly-gamma-glutamate system protein
MKRREGKISILSLSIVTLITIVFMIIELNSKTKVEATYYREKIKAATMTSQAFDIIKAHALQLNIPLDQINDPNETGLIGLQYSPITAMRGDLNAKLTSTNPNFAALLVQLLKESGANENDAVAVSFSGSYPGLNIACLCALHVLGLKPTVITSVSASMWGANYPQFTYLDMERILVEDLAFDFRTTAATIGGEDDMGRGFSPEGREMILESIRRNNIELLDIQTFEDAINERVALYDTDGDPQLLIAIGDATWLGNNLPSGHIRPHQINSGTELIPFFSQRGKSVIYLSAISELAQQYDLPVAPIPLPTAGQGSLYYRYRYSVIQAIIFLGILIIILFLVLRYDFEYYLKRRKND